MNILVNPQHELRSGWKFLVYWFLFLFFVFAISFLVATSAGPQTQLERLAFNMIPTIPAIGVLVLMARYVDRVPAAVFGATLHEGWTRDFGIGVAVSVGMLAAVTFINGASGGITMNWTAADASTKSLGITPLILIISAAQEELIFRGYPLQ